MKVASVFVGVIHCPPGRHRAFLEWHDLDHRPANVGEIPHMFHSARWIAPPESLAAREVGADWSIQDSGQYLLSYWSTVPPQQLKPEMFLLRDRLAALGRCQPMNRDFSIPWREYAHPVRAYVDPGLSFSPDSVPFLPHDGVVVTVGREPNDGGQWAADYDREILPQLFESGALISSITLMNPVDSEPGFVHLHYVRGNPIEAQEAIRAAVGPKPSIRFRASYVPQHWAEPSFYE
jgi:hypothetical protein